MSEMPPKKVGSQPKEETARNLTFVSIPVLDEFRTETDELSFCLRPSPGRGVGVFLTHGVRAGTLLTLFPTGPGGIAEHNRFLSYAALQEAPPLLRAFALVYGVEAEEGIWIPLDFSRMSIGSYLNHASPANTHHDEEYNHYASRDIEPGEELFTDYSQL